MAKTWRMVSRMSGRIVPDPYAAEHLCCSAIYVRKQLSFKNAENDENDAAVRRR